MLFLSAEELVHPDNVLTLQLSHQEDLCLQHLVITLLLRFAILSHVVLRYDFRGVQAHYLVPKLLLVTIKTRLITADANFVMLGEATASTIVFQSRKPYVCLPA